jgi:glycosyltransferase involved in cell wall biosynthesis
MKQACPFMSVIIAVYKNTTFLRLVLLSLESQQYRDFEVIIAEDDEDASVASCIEKSRTEFKYPILHVHHPDTGFRKNKILNEAINKSSGRFIQFIDGDSVLHPHYLQAFAKYAKPGFCLYGRRVYLDEKFTKNLIAADNLKTLTLYNILRSESEQKKHALYMPWVLPFQQNKVGIWGCSMGLMKEDLLKVNGFDEDYVRIGVGEDFDLEWRLLKAGIQLKPLKYYARQYHLHHKRVGRDADVNFNFELMAQKKEKGAFFCINGIDKTVRKNT